MGLDRPIDITAEQHKTILALLAYHLPNTTAWVYGSRVKWTSSPKSDLDVVVFAAPEQAGQVSDLKEAFEESNLTFRVDLFAWDEIPEKSRNTIEAEHVALVEKAELSVASGWRKSTLDQLGRIVTGKTPPSKIQGSFGGDIPFVTPTDLDGRRVIVSTGRSLTKRGVEAVFNTRIPARSVMVSCIGSDMGKTAIAARECVTNQQINSIVVDSRDEPLFVYYNLSNRKAEIRASAGGSAQPILNKSGFGQFDILLPPLPEQRAIAHILGTLDDKIELNRRMNETLEAMARALFKSWFVDFDPVHAKATLNDHAATFPQAGSVWNVERARAYLDRMDPSIAALFPDSFVDSELGPIPAGWVAGCFGDITAQRKQRIGARAAVVLSAVRTGRLVRSEEHFTKQVHSKRITNYLAVQHGDIAYNPSRINIGSVGMFKEAVLGAVSPVYVVARPESAYRSFLEFALQLAQTKQWITVLATGSVRQSLSYVDFASIPCAIPPLSAVEEFEGQWNRLREVTVTRSEEVLALTALRDVLLPKLLSGKVRVSGGVENWSR